MTKFFFETWRLVRVYVKLNTCNSKCNITNELNFYNFVIEESIQSGCNDEKIDIHLQFSSIIFVVNFKKLPEPCRNPEYLEFS